MRIRIFSFFIILFSLPVFADETPSFMPYPEARIETNQWSLYHDFVYKSFSKSLRKFPDEHLETLNSPDMIMHFAFTTPGHPAHPAWITRKSIDGEVKQIGYFAGDEAPFAILFQAYLDLTERTLDKLPDQTDSGEEGLKFGQDDGT